MAEGVDRMPGWLRWNKSVRVVPHDPMRRGCGRSLLPAPVDPGCLREPRIPARPNHESSYSARPSDVRLEAERTCVRQRQYLPLRWLADPLDGCFPRHVEERIFRLSRQLISIASGER